MSGIKRYLLRIARRVMSSLNERLTPQSILREECQRLRDHIAQEMPGNPAAHGYKVYSQCDEDGIISNIFSRIGSGKKTFVEIGCSDGLENNTHALLLDGWRGIWIDADGFKTRFAKRHTHGNRNLHIIEAFVFPNNVSQILEPALADTHIDALDFLSVDIDGADLQVTSVLAERLKPRVICVEYNAKFPPPLRVAVGPDSGAWEGDDYQGASLCSFIDALHPHGYRLVCCGLSGVNAFFIQSHDVDKFPSLSPSQLYQPARYDLRHLKSGHPSSLRFLEHQRK